MRGESGAGGHKVDWQRCNRLLFLLFFAAAAWCADDLKLTPEDRRAEVGWLASLGLMVPEGGPLLERPFEPPWSRRPFVAPTAWWRTPASKDVRADLLRQDLPLLRMLMEKPTAAGTAQRGAAGIGTSGSPIGIATSPRKGDALLDLPAGFAPFTKLMGFQLDNHTGFAEGIVRLGSISRSAFMTSAPSGVCTTLRTTSEEFSLDAKDPAQTPVKARIVGGDGSHEQGFYISYPARRGTATAIQCGGAWIALRTWEITVRRDAINALAQHSWSEPCYRRVSRRLRTCGYRASPNQTTNFCASCCRPCPRRRGTRSC